jgi:hypothetical protein
METTTINPEENKSPLTGFQQAALEDAEKELEKMRNELNETKYLIDLSKNEISILNNFILQDAPWKFTESLGVVEVEKETIKATKSGKLFTSAVAIEAIYYYLSKVEGKGKNVNASAFKDVDEYLKVLKAITAGIERIKADNEKMRQAEFVVAARREGIEPDKSLATDN